MQRVLFLKRVPLFEGFTLDELLHIDQVLVQETLKGGETVFREGSLADRLYVVYEGEIELYKGSAPTGEPVATLSAGSHFGEMALLEEVPRTLTAVTKGEVVLLSLFKDRFRALLAQRPEMLYPLCIELSRRLRELSAKFLTTPH